MPIYIYIFLRKRLYSCHIVNCHITEREIFLRTSGVTPSFFQGNAAG